MNHDGFFEEDPDSRILLLQLQRKAELAGLQLLDPPREGAPLSLGWASKDICQQLIAKMDRWYLFTWGIDRHCRPSLQGSSKGEILFWGDPQPLHGLIGGLMGAALGRGLTASWSIMQSDGTDHLLTNGQNKCPDVEWLRSTKKITVLESVWGHESLGDISDEVQAHAETGLNAIGIVLRFAGARGDAPALAKLDQMLAQDHPRRDLEQQVSVLMIAQMANGQRKRVWRLGDWAMTAPVTGPTLEVPGSVAVLPSTWFSDQPGQERVPIFLASFRHAIVTTLLRARGQEPTVEQQRRQQQTMLQQEIQILPTLLGENLLSQAKIDALIGIRQNWIQNLQQPAVDNQQDPTWD